jgi:TetR/AcrR family transcriptional repressor of nem operon
MAASASEIGRQGPAVSASFARAFEETTVMIEASLVDKELSKSQRGRLAVATVAAQIGAIAASRAVAKTDRVLANEVLQAVRKTVGSAYEFEAG